MRVRILLLCALSSASVVMAQVGSLPPSTEMYADPAESEAGIPVKDALTVQKCASCHTADSKGNLSRISWVRTTPEGWFMAIKRMTLLNGLSITADETRSIVKYLSASHGLAPEEAKPVMYLPEHRLVDETTIPNDAVRTCGSCHAFAQPLSWRRSGAEWKQVENMHIYLYSQAEQQFRRPVNAEGTAPLPPTAPLPSKPTPNVGQVAIAYMAKAAPLNTPEWSSWQSRMSIPKLGGSWAVVADVPGKGRFVGDMKIAPQGAADEFATTTTLHSLKTGETLTRTGTGTIFAGYSWRGRSDGGTKAAVPDEMRGLTRETMFFAPDQKTAEGRWFWGDYNEFGYQVKLTRADTGPVITSVMPYGLKAGTKANVVHIYGAGLPASVAPAGIVMGSGITVKKVVSATPGDITLSVDVAPTAPDGQRDVSVAGVALEKAVPVYHQIDYLKVTPETALARLGTGKHTPGYQQFDAIGYIKGADGKAHTADDIAVGPVDVTWSTQEFATVFYDDDKDFVGSLSPTALFTPASDGPNPKRRFMRNNYGDVWVVATAKAEKDPVGEPLTGRAFLVVTVPAYQRWDQPELSQ